MQSPYAQRSFEILKSKFFLIDVCFEKCLNWMSFGLTSGYGNNMRQKQILEEIRRLNCEYFVSIAQYH
jgi:hypothetical protein